MNRPFTSTEIETVIFKPPTETYLAVQWFRLHVLNAGSMGLIPGQQTKILHTTLCSKKKKKKKVIKTHDVTGLPEIIYFIVLFFL